MPAISERKKITSALEMIILFMILSDRDSTDDIATFIVIYCMLKYKRYLRRRTLAPRSEIAFNHFHLFYDREKFFKQKIRMSYAAFTYVVNLFSDHPSFTQTEFAYPVYLQFMVTFHRLGCYGNGASMGLVADYFGISGTKLLYIQMHRN